MARFSQVFGIEVCGWMRRDPEARAGVAALHLEHLFATSEVTIIQLSLTTETQGFVGPSLLESVKPDAVMVNTARGPMGCEAAPIEVLSAQRIGEAVPNVFGTPSRLDHPLRSRPNVPATPHLGNATRRNRKTYYSDALEDVLFSKAGAPLRVQT